MNLDTSHQTDIEHNIQPPFENAITIPLTGKYEGIAIYIGSSTFNPVSDEKLQEAVNDIIKKLN